MLEEKIFQLIESDLTSLGLEAVRIRVISTKTKILEILIAKLDETPLSIEECAVASRQISALLDVEDLVSGHYRLEVSSAGVERPLVQLKDFERFAGNFIEVNLYQQLDGKKKYKATLRGREGNNILLDSSGVALSIKYENIKSANIVLTEELFRKILNNKN